MSRKPPRSRGRLRGAGLAEVGEKGRSERTRDLLPLRRPGEERGVLLVAEIRHLDEDLRGDRVPPEDRRKEDAPAADHPVSDRLERLNGEPLVPERLDHGRRELPRHGLRPDPLPPREPHLGPLAGRTFTLFFLNMAIAATLGLLMMNLLQPGDRLDEETSARLIEEYSGQAQKHVETSAARPEMTPSAVVDMFMPRNLFGAFVGNQRNALGDVLPLILFAILVGAAGLKLPRERRHRFQDSLETVTELMTGIVRFALKLAPYAVPAMIFSVVVKVGFDIIIALGLFMIYPVVWMIVSSFKPNNMIFSDPGLIPKAVTIENYVTGWKGYAGTTFGTTSTNESARRSIRSARPTPRRFLSGPRCRTRTSAGAAMFSGVAFRV